MARLRLNRFPKEELLRSILRIMLAGCGFFWGTVCARGEAWLPVDGPANSGGTVEAYQFSLATANGTPFVAYTLTGGTRVIWVRRFDGDAWVPVGNAINLSGSGTNPHLAMMNDTPYVAWNEGNPLSPWNQQVHVKAYNGSSWTEVGGVLNANVNAPAVAPRLASVGTTPYAAWREQQAGGNYAILAARYNGSAWTGLGSLNRDENRDALYPDIAGDGAQPVVVWQEVDAANDTQIYVSRFNGSAWISLGGSLNVNTTDDGQEPVLAMQNTTPYVSWFETDPLNVGRVYVKGYFGGSWTDVGGALNNQIDRQARWPSLAFWNGTPYAAFSEQNGTGVYQLFCKGWTGSTWTQAGGILNLNINASAYHADLDGSVDVPYAAFFENANVYVKVLVQATPTPTRTATGTPTVTSTRTASPTLTPTPTATASPTQTRSRTITPTCTITPTGTPSPTPSPSRTPTASLTSTPTCTRTPTWTVTPTPTVTPTLTSTLTGTITPTASITPIPSATSTVYVIEPNRVITYPSPARGNTVWFYYRVDGPAAAEIEIFNVAGERVATLQDQPGQAGQARTAWDIRDVAPGVYMFRLRLTQDGKTWESAVQRLVLVKP